MRINKYDMLLQVKQNKKVKQTHKPQSGVWEAGTVDRLTTHPRLSLVNAILLRDVTKQRLKRQPPVHKGRHSPPRVCFTADHLQHERWNLSGVREMKGQCYGKGETEDQEEGKKSREGADCER